MILKGTENVVKGNEVEFKELEIGQMFVFEYTKQIYIKMVQSYPWMPNAFNLMRNETIEFNPKVKVIPINYELNILGVNN